MSIRIVTDSVWNNPGNRGQRLWRMLAAARWQFYKRVIQKPLLLSLLNGKKFVAHADCVVSSSLIYADYPEYYELQFVRGFLRATDSIIDVGANVGHIGLLLGDLVDSSEIYAFEPTPFTFKRLKENWELNSTSSPPHLYQMAIGDRDGEVLMPDRQEPSTMNSIISANEADAVGMNVVSVRISSLDSLRETWKCKSIGFLKIDVEGHEDAVFQGARSFIANIRPRLIMFESLTGSLSPVIADVLSAAKFDVFQLEEGKPVFGRHTKQNLFACPNEQSENVLYTT